jgi:endonuclease/exonuclease/phosphatase family metal-dependent hydrolase
MNWNINDFDNQVTFLSISRLINNLDCDIVCLQESYKTKVDTYFHDKNELDELGGIWFTEKYNSLYPSNKYILNIKNYFGTRSIISKYPFIETPSPFNNIGTFIKINNTIIFVCNIHLPAYPWQLEEIDKNNLKTYKSVIESSNNTRGDHIDYILEQLNYIPSNIPIFLLGDFNEPSFLDYLPYKIQKNNINENKENKENEKEKFVIDRINFPTSIKIINNGFTDSLFNSPNYNKEIKTWNSLKLYYKHNCETHELYRNKDKNEQKNHLNSRIDFIYYKNGINLLDFHIINDNPTLKCKPYPSDHFALFGKYKIVITNNIKHHYTKYYIYLFIILVFVFVFII